MSGTTNLLLPLIAAAQAQKHVTHNEALLQLDAIVQLAVIDRDLTAPPAEPGDGDRYIPASGATGAWAGWDLSIAWFVDGVWTRLVPRQGWRAWAEDEGVLLVWDGAAWQQIEGGGGLAIEAFFRVHQDGVAQTIASATVTKMVWGAEGADEGGHFDLPNSKWVPPAGLAVMTVSLRYSSGIVDQQMAQARIHKNGSVLFAGQVNTSGTGDHRPMMTVFDFSTGSDEYEVFAFANGAGDKTIGAADSNTFWTGFVLVG